MSEHDICNYDDEAPGSIEKPKKTHDNCRYGYWERDENYHLHMCELHPERIWGVEQKDCDQCDLYQAEFSAYYLRPKKQTNADHIRAMSDEELAWFYAKKIASCYGCESSTMEDCAKCWLEWLKQETSD